ncbi:hypothetical protein ASPWEDRAFT_69899 [Aspergillus wentii DTO 134E9]|uniref:DJ-1/PfpI domain-containing protein n=1 Tax=Aspergillus wentii DTO 134E9 TaxID=1073089 RepID=A0A1L9RGW6_ASPWE|nr:uncharacterized protein ASPWEDRAFT_69899 [Aspergillus wentii DTO 134E9]KAI9927944.1 hypothetical protein MW887_002796 [Aspergillus wentii]OJJ34171.1 hypothetical protein ASPWEDRAFT_69899 [Aspergillus wentii DTO 134E9]
MTSQPLRIGVLLVDCVQLLDLAAIDLFNMTTPEYLQSCHLPQPLMNLARPCEIHYIGAQPAGTIQPTTAQMSLSLTACVSDEFVAPGKLDVLLIPGPDPSVVPPETMLEFVRGHDEAGTTILSICTGIYVVAYAGLHKGRKVTGPRFLIPQLKEKFPEAEVWDSELRVVRDGRLWSCGGITNGHDMVAEYLRQNYPDALVNAILAMADVEDRGLHYSSSVTRDNAFFVWQIAKALPAAVLKMITG